MNTQKTVLRGQMKSLRENLHAQDNTQDNTRDLSAARVIASQILQLPEIAGEVQRGIRASRNEPHIVAGFLPIQSEIDCLFILKTLSAIQCRCALPTISSDGDYLAFKEWDLLAELKDGPYGTREPAADFGFVMPDVILVPLLAFDDRGHRLGYGGGYYDRTLKLYRDKGHAFTAIGIAFDGQRVDHLPTDPHDQPLDLIVTEKKVYRP